MAENPLPVDRPVDRSSKTKEPLWFSVDRSVDRNKQRVTDFQSAEGRSTEMGSGRPIWHDIESVDRSVDRLRSKTEIEKGFWGDFDGFQNSFDQNYV